MSRSFLFIGAAVILAALASHPALAADPTVEELTKQIADLNKVVAEQGDTINALAATKADLEGWLKVAAGIGTGLGLGFVAGVKGLFAWINKQIQEKIEKLLETKQSTFQDMVLKYSLDSLIRRNARIFVVNTSGSDKLEKELRRSFKFQKVWTKKLGEFDPRNTEEYDLVIADNLDEVQLQEFFLDLGEYGQARLVTHFPGFYNTRKDEKAPEKPVLPQATFNAASIGNRPDRVAEYLIQKASQLHLNDLINVSDKA